MTRLPLLLAGLLTLAALAVPGPRRALAALRDLVGMLRGQRVALAAAVLAVVLLPFLSRWYVDHGAYLTEAAASTVAAVAAFVLARRFAGLSARFTSAVLRASPLVIALLATAAGLLVCFLVLGNIPHVSDEVAYQFQARTLALGRLYLPPPPSNDAFLFIHTMVDGNRWYGIMNPGWPLILAAGELLRMPWLVNPLLGGLALVALYRAFRAGGVGETESRTAIFLLAISPLLLFMNGTYMAHPANLLLLALFCWAWARMLETGGWIPAAAAGGVLAFNLLVRPVDTAAVAVPFGLLALWQVRRRPRLLGPVLLAGLIASLGVVATLAYNHALTGDALSMPMAKYFYLRNPHERFGIGFGADMGTKIHGPEWPGFYPKDAVRVTAYRLAQFVTDLYGLPLLILALPVAALRRRDWSRWHLAFFASALSLMAVYFFHFYHGIAYGSRHYYLAAPAVALLLARPLAGGLEGTGTARSLAQASLTALVLLVVVYALPPLVRTYGSAYRESSSVIRVTVEQAHLEHALVFVDERNWAWKSAFPLNRYPLSRSSVVFAKDVGADDAAVAAHFPGRLIYHLSLDGQGRVTLRRTDQP